MKRVIFWVLLISNIIISIIMPAFIFPRIFVDLTSFESVMSALLTAIVLFLIEIYIYVNIMYQIKNEAQEIIKIDTESDKKLFNITQFVREINHSRYQPNDLFSFYIDKK